MNENELIENIKEDLYITEGVYETAIFGDYSPDMERMIRNIYKAGFNKGVETVLQNIEKYSLWKKND